eukprot:6201560-Pleurochrysis_carterae.AAC.1
MSNSHAGYGLCSGLRVAERLCPSLSPASRSRAPREKGKCAGSGPGHACVTKLCCPARAQATVSVAVAPRREAATNYVTTY